MQAGPGRLAPPLADGERRVPWERYRAALLRFKWLVLGISVVGSAAGFVASKFVKPEYEVQATVWISTESPQSRSTGPIRAQQLLNVTTWPELLRSFTVLDRVVHRMRLYLVPVTPADTAVFAGFTVADRFRPGEYVLHVDAVARNLSLRTKEGAVIEQRAFGDSIGTAVGFRWRPAVDGATRAQDHAFTVLSPRAASIRLRERLGHVLPEESSLMRLRLSGGDPELTAETMNVLVEQFVDVAADLKKRNLVEFARTLEEQLEYAQRELRAAEIALENFRVNTITLPSEGGPVAGGVEMTRNPVFDNFFEQKIELDNVRRDREALERTLAEVRRGELRINAFWAIPSVQEVGRNLVQGLNDYASREAALRALLQVYTEEHADVREARRVLNTLRTVEIPPLVASLIDQLRLRESDLENRIASASRELREIPQRAIEETRLERNQSVREALYTTLRSRYEEASLAEASSTPDVIALDAAAAPQEPSRTVASRILLLAIAGSVGFGVFLAILLDRIDPRFRYPEQATDELGLTILGALPAIPKTLRGSRQHEAAAQVIEAFRSVRLSITSAIGPVRPIMFTVSSAGVGEGKSLVCSNLALSFTDAGFRTLLIDGDTRRGELHTLFGVDRRPGLLDHLAGDASLDEVLRTGQHERLTILPSGSRRRSGPELLTSPALPQLLAVLRSRYDVIIIDSPPLGAGIDPFVLSSATSNLLMVLRAGTTDRRMAEAKLKMMDRLPVRVLGAVVNDIKAEGVYKYYSYLYYGYAAEDESMPGMALTAPVSGPSWSGPGRTT